jgi:hypothetical protein
LVAALVLAGLPSLSPVYAQTAINSSAVDTLEPYVTKKKDVIALFGQPSNTVKIGNEELLVYKTTQKDPVQGKDSRNLLTVTIGWGDFVTQAVYKKYCER